MALKFIRKIYLVISIFLVSIFVSSCNNDLYFTLENASYNAEALSQYWLMSSVPVMHFDLEIKDSNLILDNQNMGQIKKVKEKNYRWEGDSIEELNCYTAFNQENQDLINNIQNVKPSYYVKPEESIYGLGKYFYLLSYEDNLYLLTTFDTQSALDFHVIYTIYILNKI